jgi:hypothetical protein
MRGPYTRRSRSALLALLLLALCWPTASIGHPMSRDAYSLRNAVKLGPDGLQAVVILEVPADVVMGSLLEDFEGGATGEELDEQVARAKVRRWNEGQWDLMGAGLKVFVNGEEAPGEWGALRSDANGKGGEGFFVYMVGFRPKSKAAPIWDFGDEATIEIRNTIYPDKPMFLSALVSYGDGWTIGSNSAKDVIGEKAEVPDLTNPDAWSEDPSLRTLTVVYQRVN